MHIQKGVLVSLQENREHHPPGNGGRLAGRVPLQHQLRGCQRVHQHTDRDEEIRVPYSRLEWQEQVS